MKLRRVFADANGETHFERVEIAQFVRPEDGPPARAGIKDIPATTLTVTTLLQRMPAGGPRPAPRRQLIVVLGGAMEVTTSSGDSERFDAGDCLLTEDLVGEGHTPRDVGSDPLSTLTIGIDERWQFPTVGRI